jgi:Tol biopolymer transport system component
MRRPSLLLVTSLFALLPACDRPGDPVAEGDILAPQMTALLHDDWGPAVRLGGDVALNTSSLEGCPNESPDGRSLFFASNRGGDIDIWVSQRDDGGDWGEPELLPKGLNTVNSGANDYCPTALPGGGLLFVSERGDGQNCGVGTADIYESRLHPELGWLEPTHLGCVINSPGAEFAPSYVPAGGGMLFFSSNRGLDGKHAIYVSHRGPGGEWQTPDPVQELNAIAFNSFRPNVSPDGRVIVFDSDRPTSLGIDIWYSQRATPHGTWSEPVRLTSDGVSPINSGAGETRASLSRDGKRLYFGSNRDATQSFDIFVAERR